MRTVYALSFHTPTEPDEGRLPLERLADRLATWATRKVPRKPPGFLDGLFDGPSHSVAHEGHRIGASLLTMADQRLLEFSWSHPDMYDKSLEWTVGCSVAEDPARTEVALSLRVRSRSASLAPVHLRVGTPRIVRDALSSLDCRIGSWPVATEPAVLSAEGVEAFIDERLTAPDRTLPIVLVSPDRHSDIPLVRPDRIAQQCMGLCEVHTLESKWAGFKLVDLLGPRWTCHSGAIRVFWPGFRPTNHQRRHPLFLPDDVLGIEDDGRGMDRVLFDLLAPVSTFRFSDSPIARDIRRRLSEAERQRQQELRATLAHIRAQDSGQDTVSKADYDELIAEVERSWDRVTELEAALEARELRVMELQDQLTVAEDNLAAIYSHGKAEERTGEGHEDTRGPGPRGAPRTVLEAIERAAAEYDDVLEVWKSATDSARATSFARPAEVFSALHAIAEVGRMVYPQDPDDPHRIGSLGRRWQDVFSDMGFKYAASESSSTMNQYAKERTFKSARGRRLEMQKHLTLGGGDRNNCLQIFIETDDQSRKIIIGYCGVHLPYARART